ncbi:hypothetical protein ACF9IK_12490 [Kitasatospora hibisci]|uniref:hypothetical protein n=1 Tax=Kitasatospora hibisci TaxID=3369522 RepID=UPI00375487D1
MNAKLPDRSPGFDDPPPSVPEPVQVWAAYGVSAAAGLHLVVAALVLINRTH